MNEKILKKNKLIEKARKHKFKWILMTLLGIIFIIFIFFLIGYFLPNLLLFVLIPGFIFLFAFAYYRIYVLILAELCQCNYCGCKFYTGFWRCLAGNLFMGSTRRSKVLYTTTAVDNDRNFVWSTAKCPNCGNSLILSECEVGKND